MKFIRFKTYHITKTLLFFSIVLAIGMAVYTVNNKEKEIDAIEKDSLSIENRVPIYDGNNYIILNNNKPLFDDKDKTNTAFEIYSELDSLGRCGPAYANVCKDIMPTEKRGEIGHIKPTGWVQAKYDGLVNSNPPYLYNRCHLIAFCLAGENDNPKNLITGTRHFNVEGMLPWEEKVLKYVKETNNHVLYRVTPIFENDDLVAKGVVIEAYSIEDGGKGIEFNIFVHNVQPGIEIDYKTGKSKELQK